MERYSFERATISPLAGTDVSLLECGGGSRVGGAARKKEAQAMTQLASAQFADMLTDLDR